MKKICNVCLIEKDLSEYYYNVAMRDGHQNRCKECTKNVSKLKHELIKSNPMLLEKERERHRNKYHRLGYKDLHKPCPESKKIIMEKYNKKYPEKRLAKNACSKMKSSVQGSELHHWSYRTEHVLDVIELSVKDHAKLHRYMFYDQERMMYRRSDTRLLLDTREAHIAYYESLKDKP